MGKHVYEYVGRLNISSAGKSKLYIFNTRYDSATHWQFSSFLPPSSSLFTASRKMYKVYVVIIISADTLLMVNSGFNDLYTNLL